MQTYSNSFLIAKHKSCEARRFVVFLQMKTMNVNPITTSKTTISLFHTCYLQRKQINFYTFYIFKDNKKRKK